MNWPSETWRQMLLISWAVLVGSAIPLVILTPIRRRAGKDVKGMWVKYGAWFIMVPAVTVPMLLGTVWLQIALLLLSLYAFGEYSRAVGLWRERAHLWLARGCIVLAYLPVFLHWYGLFVSIPAFVILLIFAYPIARDLYEGMIQRTCLTILGVVYFGWFLAHLAFLVELNEGRAMLLAFLLIVIVNDASAYLIGSTVGRHPLVPRLSSKKTVEGALGALLVAVCATFAVRFALGGITIADTLILGFVLGVAGMCGDLAISMIKRDVHIKDSGTLIPGHGGLLDRLDSVLFAAPIFFHYMNYFYDIVRRGT